MAKNVEINILGDNGNYEALYPKINLNNNDNNFLSIEHGGIGAQNASVGLYNLISGCITRTASLVNSNATNTYLGAYYGSNGYKIPVSNLMTYINNNINTTKISSGVVAGTGALLSQGSTVATLNVGFTPKFFAYFEEGLIGYTYLDRASHEYLQRAGGFSNGIMILTSTQWAKVITGDDQNTTFKCAVVYFDVTLAPITTIKYNSYVGGAQPHEGFQILNGENNYYWLAIG